MPRKFALIVLASSAPILAIAAEPAECPRNALLSASAKLEAVYELPPDLVRGSHGPLRTISLYESELASDHYRYSALLFEKENQVWVYRYGGYNGSIAWFGPVAVPAGTLESCPPARGPIWLDRHLVLSGYREQKAKTLD